MKKSKLAKVLTVSLAALMVFGLASCGGGSGKDIRQGYHSYFQRGRLRNKRCVYRADWSSAG